MPDALFLLLLPLSLLPLLSLLRHRLRMPRGISLSVVHACVVACVVPRQHEVLEPGVISIVSLH